MKRWFLAAVILLWCVWFIFWPRHHSNVLLLWGFPVRDRNVVLEVWDPNLKGEQRFLKAELTVAEAKDLRKAFARFGGTVYDIEAQQRFLRKMKIVSQGPDLMSGLDNPQWKPSSVKQGWVGGFAHRESSSVFLCSYVMDTKNPEKVVLYFYGITFDD